MIQMRAVMSEWERDQISERTKAVLTAAKARGVALGATGPTNLRRHIEGRQEASRAFRERLLPVLNGFLAQGLSRRATVERLNDLGTTSTAPLLSVKPQGFDADSQLYWQATWALHIAIKR